MKARVRYGSRRRSGSRGTAVTKGIMTKYQFVALEEVLRKVFSRVVGSDDREASLGRNTLVLIINEAEKELLAERPELDEDRESVRSDMHGYLISRTWRTSDPPDDETLDEWYEANQLFHERVLKATQYLDQIQDEDT
jgi:hypothetical protein